MKVALVHDYIKEYGGAERVLEALHDIFPDAPVYTSVFLPDYLGPHKERFSSWNIKTSWAQYLPFKQKLISPLRILSPLLFKSFNLSEFDVIITSATGAYFPNNVTKGKAKLVCYCHTPPRYLYGYATARDWRKHKIGKVIGEGMNHILRMIDYSVSQKVDVYIANSQEVARRIKKFYRKDARVINPPVITSHNNVSDEKDERTYFVTGGRLARAKHVDLIIETCTTRNLPLKVFGRGFAGYEDELQKRAGKTITFVGEVSDEEKRALLRGARAFLFASEDEDFGITPVEAMSEGTPVIAFRSGGVQETVIDGKTGIFFDDLTQESMQEALEQFETMRFSSQDCIKRAEEFSEDQFTKKITTLIS